MIISRNKTNLRENFRVIAEHVTDYYFAPHMHSECEYVYMLGGECTLHLNFRKITIKKGEAFFFLPWQLHSVEGAPGSEMHIITFSAAAISFFDDYIDVDFTDAGAYIPSPDITKIITDELIDRRCADPITLCACANLLCSDFLKNNPALESAKARGTDGNLEHNAAKYIREHYTEELTLARVAQAVGTSASYLSRVMNLKNELGFSKYLNELRISHAQMLLRTTDMKISDIAKKSGYTNIRTFNRIFKEHFFQSPSDMRLRDKSADGRLNFKNRKGEKIMAENIKMIAHRGFSGKFHENTEQAFKQAALHGSAGAETDIRATKDGIFVCSHNSEIVLADGTELIVAEHTFDELTAQPLKNKRTDDEVYLCKYERYLEIMKQNNMICFVEFKGSFTNEQVKEVFALTARVYDMKKCILQSFDFDNLVRTHALFPDLGIMWTYGKGESHYENCFDYGFSIDADKWVADEEMVKAFHDRGLEVGVWTANTKEELELCRNLGVDYIESDFFGPED